MIIIVEHNCVVVAQNAMECLRVLCVFNVIFCVVHKEKYYDLQIFHEEEKEEETHSAHYLFLQEEKNVYS